MNIIPGIVEILNKKYYQGFILFFIFLFSLLNIIKLRMFEDFYNLNEELIYAFLLCTSIIWHFIFLGHIKKIKRIEYETEDDIYQKGRVAFLKQNFELALLHFKSLLKKKPDDEDVIYQLLKTYLELNKIKEAKILLKNYSQFNFSKWKHEIKNISEELSGEIKDN